MFTIKHNVGHQLEPLNQNVHFFHLYMKISLPSCNDESIGSKKWLELVQVQDDTDSY